MDSSPAVLTWPEIGALLAVASDYAVGQPPGAQLRATTLAVRTAEAAKVSEANRQAVWWAGALRFLGCTGHAYDMAALFGDEIEMRARAAHADLANPFDVMKLMVTSAGAGKSAAARLGAVLSVLAGGKREAELNFRTACEVGDILARRLLMPSEVTDALAASFERWNGRGLPRGLARESIPLPMRVVHVAQDFEVLARVTGPDQALREIGRRRGRAYDPALSDLVVENGAEWWSSVEDADSWQTALASAPSSLPLSDAEVQEVLLVLADFADIKSPWTAGHSRGVATLAGAVCDRETERAALVHDLGRVGVPNTIWDKPRTLTRDERDRAETHTLLTEQILCRVPALQALATVAASSHERVDGSGYHHRWRATQLTRSQRVLAAADVYQALTSDRPHRAAMQRAAAAQAVRQLARDGELDGDAVEDVLAADGHKRQRRATLPAGLTAREAEVLVLLCRGYTTREIANHLVISAKTADHHIQHIYTKIGASTRGAAALFAAQHGLANT